MTTKGGKDYRIFLPALEDPGDRHDDAGRGADSPRLSVLVVATKRNARQE